MSGHKSHVNTKLVVFSCVRHKQQVVKYLEQQLQYKSVGQVGGGGLNAMRCAAPYCYRLYQHTIIASMIIFTLQNINVDHRYTVCFQNKKRERKS